jgi:tetratricopeptide (TPR) repeat protein
VEAGHPHYMEGAIRFVRALIWLARGDKEGAVAESERLLATARAAQDAQVFFPSLAVHGHVLFAAGRRADALALVDELLERLQTTTSALLSYWTLHLAVVLTSVGRGAELESVAANAKISTRWLEIALAYTAGDFVAAADALSGMGAVSDEAFFRLRAAEALIEAGRRAEGDVQLQQALTFYRSVGATRYVREAEGLLAATA